MVANFDSGRVYVDSGDNSRQWWSIVTVVESMWTVVDSGDKSRQWWPIVTVVESTVVDSDVQWRQ